MIQRFYEEKAKYFTGKRITIRKKKRWYYEHYKGYKARIRLRKVKRFLRKLRLPLYLSFVRWVIVDFLSGKERRFMGIYQFVGLPGQGKTLSMVAHMERARKNHPDVIIGSNFNYKYERMPIKHWSDIIKISTMARKENVPCIIAMDEIHVTFDASDWQSFPAELLALLSFNRKFQLQFLCSAQIYERIPRKIRDIANYTVICKNFWNLDRYFINYYFEKNNYEAKFAGNRAKAEFIVDFVASDDLYNCYNTLEQVENLTANAKEEKAKKEAAFELLFGNSNSNDLEDSMTDMVLPARKP